MMDDVSETLTATQQSFVGGRIVRSDILNSTGVYSFLKETGALEAAKDALAGVLTGAVESKFNDRFHAGLGFFEKLGFLSDRKYEAHCRRVAFAKGTADFFTRSAVDFLLPRSSTTFTEAAS